MRPLKKYVFQNIDSENITITILAYSFEAAMNRLVFEMKHPADYKLISEQP